ncbi:WhiB family transcriptional regulator, partial [Nocardiopsis gilva]|uniref:WhiB family transcriptional regulator n=1 Tax=Nocardiopsis gilva TaxID=280236 RepID=UPI00037E266B
PPCRGEDINLFFGPDGEHQTAKEAREDKAREICHVCPIRRECAEYALTAPERDGFWGGLNEDERTSERRRRTRRANAA